MGFLGEHSARGHKPPALHGSRDRWQCRRLRGPRACARPGPALLRLTVDRAGRPRGSAVPRRRDSRALCQGNQAVAAARAVLAWRRMLWWRGGLRNGATAARAV